MTTDPSSRLPRLDADLAPQVHLNLKVRGLRPSSTVAINELSNRLRAEGKRVFKLGLGQSPFPVPAPVVEALRANAHQKDYLPVCGLRTLREAIADQHRREHGVECDADDVLVGPGSKELMFLLQLVYYGDLVIPTPTWVSYSPQAQIIGRSVRPLPTRARNGWKVTADQLEELCAHDPGRPRIVILNYPTNPTGTTYSAAELEAIAAVARKYRILLLSDEIYSKLHFRGEHTSIVPLYPEGTIYSGGLSKWCGAGGWRLGMFVFPRNLRWLLEAMAVAASETYTSTSAPIQHAAVRAFADDPELEEYVDRSRRVLRALGPRLAARLRSAGARVREPEGGFYLFPDLTPLQSALRRRGVRTSAELCRRLLEDVGVAVLPGSDFGRPEQELTLRLAYVDFDGAAALEAAGAQAGELGEDFVRRVCGDTVEAVDRIAEWLAG